MKAMAQTSWTRGAPLALVELPTPTPGPRDVVVSVRAIGVNPVDWKMRSYGPLRIAARLLGPKPPVVVGVDFAGVVTAVGAAVEGLRPGDRVVGGTDFSRRQRGSYADTVVVRDDQLCLLPDGVPFDVAGALPVVGVTAHLSVFHHGRVRRGDRVLVLGASGGVGQLVTQIAVHAGAVVVGVCSGRNVERVRALGAHDVIDYTEQDALDAARAFGPYRAVIDCVGGHSGPRCRALLEQDGRLVVVSGDTPMAIVDGLLSPRRTRAVLGSVSRERLQPVVDAVAEGWLHVPIAERLPLHEAERAHALSRSGRMVGKLVLVPDVV